VTRAPIRVSFTVVSRAHFAIAAVLVPFVLSACSGGAGTPTGADGGGAGGAGGGTGGAGGGAGGGTGGAGGGAGGAGGGTGGAGGGAGGAGGSTGGTGGGTGGGCVFGTAVVPSAGSVDTISAHGDTLLYVDRSVGPSGNFPGEKAGALKQMNIDGSGETTLYAAPASTSIRSYLATTDEIYLLQVEGVSPAAAVLYTLPRAGGTPTPVPTTQRFDSLLSYPFAANGDSLFIFSPQVSGSHMQIHRVSISTGADVVIADKDTLVFTGNQLSDGKVWFAAGQGSGGVFAVDATASAPSSAAAVTTDTCGYLLVGSTFFLCTSGDTNRYDPSGTKTGPFQLPGSNNPAAVLLDGDTVYSIPRLDTPPYEIHAVSVSTGQSRLAACGRGFISSLTLDATNLVWKENGPSGPTVVRVSR
jgi:hypothetical protein